MENEPLYILKKYWGYDGFRNSQEAVINSVLSGKDTLALLPTGGGKSITFQVPAMMKEGICIVVSPLVALMTDQVEALKNREIRALSLSGGLPYPELERLLNNALYGQYKFLYLSPERLQQELVRSYLKAMSINLIVIDEAHCVSHWGKDFRPAYLQCKWLKEEFPNVPLLALTASATHQVQQDILHHLGIENATIISTSLARPNIAYKVYKVSDKWHELLQLLRKTEGSAIVYLRSRNGCIQLAELLQNHGISAAYFHGGLPAEEKNQKLSMWLLNDVRVMAATNAFGMGIDKPDVRFVIHWDIPQTLEDYFQEAGRAGRDGNPAEAILFYGKIDVENANKLLKDYLVDIPFLKLLYAKLNAYFQIAIGEGQEGVFSFFFPDFWKRYQLSPIKSYNGLQVLDRMSIISLSQQFYKKVTLHITAPAPQLITYLQTHRYLKNLVIYLIRSYPLIYSQPITLEMEKITISKNLKEYNHTKLSLQEAVFRYLQNEDTCRNIQLLEYFGEKSEKPCGVCSNCIAKLPPSKVDKKEVKKAVWSLLKSKPITPNELLIALPFPAKDINKVLEELLYMQKIAYNNCNELVVNS